MVRMVQDFSLRHPLIDGQGNFGSIDGDNAAANRYTEARLDHIAMEMLVDIDKDTVDFMPNYDETLKEPTVLPARAPNLLINGTSGIAVGMATNFAPHNLGEVAEGIIYFLDHPEAEVDDLMKYIKAPDFPTGAIIYGTGGVRDAYHTGLGKVHVRARCNVETSRSGKDRIIVSELPYQVNKVRLIEKIVELVKERKIEGITDIRDESDRDGMRLVVELKRDSIAKVVLNNLYKHTQLQTTFGINQLALVKGQPKLLNLREIVALFVEHRLEVIVRRTRFEMEKARARAHILEGLKIALDHIDEVISIIRHSETPDIAKLALIDKFDLTEIQSRAILDMKLQRLTGLEREKLEQELAELLDKIKRLQEILANESIQKDIIKDELRELAARFGNPRRTEVVKEDGEFSIEDMIAEEDVVITISNDGFIKRFPVSSFKKQNRGGRGMTGATTKEEDFIEHLFIGSTHNYVLFFTDRGRVYWLKVHEIPHAGRASKGRAIVNLLEKPRDEKISSVLMVQDFSPGHYVLMCTQRGIIKKTPLENFSRPRRAGIIAIDLHENDILIDVTITDGDHNVIVATREGKAVHFKESAVRSMGRTAAGVKAVSLDDPHNYVVGMVAVARDDRSLLVVSENGYGKRSRVSDYRLTSRGVKGVWTLRVNEKTGPLVSIKEVHDKNDLMIITTRGILIRQPVNQIRVMGRATQGVRLIRLDEGDAIASVAVVPYQEELDNNGGAAETPPEGSDPVAGNDGEGKDSDGGDTGPLFSHSDGE
jgi:DNA gyrase subunit A